MPVDQAKTRVARNALTIAAALAGLGLMLGAAWGVVALGPHVYVTTGVAGIVDAGIYPCALRDEGLIVLRYCRTGADGIFLYESRRAGRLERRSWYIPSGPEVRREEAGPSGMHDVRL